MRNKFFAEITLFSIFFIHTLLILVDIIPSNPLTYNSFLENPKYINYFLPQYWSFFAPRPVATDLVLQVQCNDGEWETPTHFYNSKRLLPVILFKPASFEYTIYSQIEDFLGYYKNHIESGTEGFLKIKKSTAYARLLNISKRFCTQTTASQLSHLKFKILDINPPPISQKLRTTSNTVDELILPEIKLEN